MAADNNEREFARLKRLFRLDREFSAKWRKEAKEDFDFVAGEQWSDDDKEHLRELMRPLVTFNRTATVVNAVSGHEMSNRQEVRYIPREMGDVKPNELLTSAALWFRDQSMADDEDSEAFMAVVIAGMGWTDTTLDYEQEEEGAPKVDELDPLKMYWDRNARKHNLIDAKRVWYAQTLTRTQAQELFPDANPEDLDAKWATPDQDEGEVKNQDQERKYQDDSSSEEADDADNITIIHCQYFVPVKAWKVVSPFDGQTTEMSAEEYKTWQARAKELGLPVVSTELKRSEIRDAWLGSKILKTGKGLCKDHFRYQCVTGFRDHNKGTFYGLVRGMKDPQRWANKWLSQSMDILNSQAKGGLIVERDFVDDVREFEKNYARPDKPLYVKPGALGQYPKLIPKPQAQFPAGFFQLMEFAIGSIRDVPGVNVEMMGMADRDQPASLEYQRRQSGMIIMQPLLKNLKRFRADCGKVMLYIIQNYLSDGRLIRIVGDEGAQYVPLMKQADVKYDIIVDDAPSAPNQKEMVWAMIGEHYFELPPELQMVFAEYLPLPSGIIDKIKKAYESQGESEQAQLEMQNAKAEVGLKEAQIVKTEAEAQATMAEIGADDPQAELQRKQAETMGKLAIEQTKAQASIEIQRQKMAGEQAMKRQDQVLDHALRTREAMQNQQIRERETSSSIALKERTTDATLAMQAKAAKAKARQSAQRPAAR